MKSHVFSFLYFFNIIQSQNNMFATRKEGEPKGYCVVWSLWYLHYRLKNSNMNRRTLISKALDLLSILINVTIGSNEL